MKKKHIRKLLLILVTMSTIVTLFTIKTEARMVNKDFVVWDGGSGTISVTDLKINETYSSYDTYPLTLRGESLYGISNCQKIESGLAGKIWKTSYKKGIAKYNEAECYENAFCVYKVDKIINLPYSSNTPEYCEAGDTATKTVLETEAETYETSVSHTLGIGGSLTSSVKIGIDIVDVGASRTNTINGTITKVSKNTSYHSKQTSTSVVKPIKQTGIYIPQRRATYVVYIILVFDIEYTVTEKYGKSGIWNTTTYAYSPSYVYKGSYIAFQFVSEIGNALLQYKVLDNGCIAFNDSTYAGLNTNHLYI